MDPEKLRQLLERLKEGELSVDEAVQDLVELPFRDLGHTKFDTHRELRSGVGEVVFAAQKTIEELSTIVDASFKASERLLLTRLSPDAGAALADRFPTLRYFPRSGTAVLGEAAPRAPHGSLGILTAGTSDAAVAEEAQVSAEYFGLETSLITDVGVAGLPRLLAQLPHLHRHDLLLVIAGMEGALPSVVSGLTPVPIIAVPTSVGYGASLHGVTALLAMLVSCSPGLTVVNIDNGFGAALAAAKFIRHLKARSVSIDAECREHSRKSN